MDDLFNIVSEIRQLIEAVRARGLLAGMWRRRTTVFVLAGLVFGAIKVREKVLLREELQPGEQILITETIVRATRRQKRARARHA